MAEEIRAQWDGDALKRKPIADFLHRYLVQKYEASGADAGAICFALDGDWGVGKTFFVTKWGEDIEGLQHPVIHFDAWKNDLSEEPLMGFIGALQLGLKKWQATIPVGDAAAKQAKKASANMIRKAGRAVFPASAFVGKALVKKLSGVALDDLFELFTHSEEQGSSPAGGEGASELQKVKEGTLDKFFEASVHEHANHLQAIDDLKSAVRDLLRHLEERAHANLPVFVFIDELDRCRPNYAIELLEGVKHLFDVRGLCFCFSTNIAQLSESVKGVYGGGFDGYRYLKRFFAFDYALPQPTDHQFSRLLIAGSLIARRLKLASGLVGIEFDQDRNEESIAMVFHFVACAFRLDLRSQRQVFDIADAASTGVSNGIDMHLFFLFALAALRHRDRVVFNSVASYGSDDRNRARLVELIDPLCKHEYKTRITDMHHRGELVNQEIAALELFLIYLDLSRQDLKIIVDRINTRQGNDYPTAMLRAIAVEMPGQYYPAQAYPPSIASYPLLIETAGQLKIQTADN